MTSELVKLNNKRESVFSSTTRVQIGVKRLKFGFKQLSYKIQVAVISFERLIAFNKNQKQLFSYLRRWSTVNTSITVLTKTDLTITEPCNITDHLNCQFESVFQVETDVDPEHTTATIPLIEKLVVNENMIANKFTKLDAFKSIGWCVRPNSLHNLHQWPTKPLDTHKQALSPWSSISGDKMTMWWLNKTIQSQQEHRRHNEVPQAKLVSSERHEGKSTTAWDLVSTDTTSSSIG